MEQHRWRLHFYIAQRHLDKRRIFLYDVVNDECITMVRVLSLEMQVTALDLMTIINWKYIKKKTKIIIMNEKKERKNKFDAEQK